MATLGTDLFSFNYVYDIVGKLIGEYNNFSPAASPCATCYLTRDHLGSVRLVTDGASNLVARHDYLPFGQEIAAGAWAGRDSWFDKQDVNQNFTGKERDSESGLDYFGARYYGSALGRFTSPDTFKGRFDNLDGQPAFSPGPIGYADLSDPQTLNMYVYTRNHPLRYVDPDGHDFLDYLSGSPTRLLATMPSALADPVAVMTISEMAKLLVTRWPQLQDRSKRLVLVHNDCHKKLHGCGS